MATEPGDRAVDWVVFDLGETLVDETAVWTAWARWLDVPPLTFFAVMGAVIADRRPHTDAIAHFRPGIDLPAEIARMEAAGQGWWVGPSDLYRDALPALIALRDLGYRLAVMANQPAHVESFLATLPVDRVATSAGWGVAKPDPEFFGRVAAEVDAAPSRIAYVGDRVDNDVVPSKRAGMLAVHIRRGPWGVIQSAWPEAAAADLRVDSLAELVSALGPGTPTANVRA